MSLRKQAVVALSSGLVLVTLAGCGAAGATGDGAAAASGTQTSPLNEIMSQVWGSDLSQEEQQRRLDEESMRREELIAQCMNQAGFEYLPNPNAGGTIIVGSDDIWRPDDRDWVSQYGYGAVNSPWNTQQNEPVADDAIVTETEWFDPNQEMLDSLTESERQAWSDALWGPSIDWEAEGIISSEGVVLDMDAWNEARGCSGWAWGEIDAESAFNVMQSDEFLPLMEAMNRIWEELAVDPEMLATDREWSSCMADSGHPGFTNQTEAQNSIWDAMNEVSNSIDWENWDWTLGSPNASNSPAHAALAEREIELALADLDCREAVDFRARQSAIQFARETQFINDHRAALDALIDAVENR